MTINWRNLFLKSIPYLLSITGGAALFLLTKDEISDPELADLVTNMSASLLSIPLVFLLYDYSNYQISRKLKKAQRKAATMSAAEKN